MSHTRTESERNPIREASMLYNQEQQVKVSCYSLQCSPYLVSGLFRLGKGVFAPRTLLTIPSTIQSWYINIPEIPTQE